MTLDLATTSLVGVSIGAIGVVTHAMSQRLEGNYARLRDQAGLALFFPFFSGFLFAWVWFYAAPVLVSSTGLAAVLTGALWGGFVWGAFTLPTGISQVIWGRQPIRASAADLAAWLSQFLIGGAICGTYLLP